MANSTTGSRRGQRGNKNSRSGSTQERNGNGQGRSESMADDSDGNTTVDKRSYDDESVQGRTGSEYGEDSGEYNDEDSALARESFDDYESETGPNGSRSGTRSSGRSKY